jgi:PIN domain nuclease of toxin-antitoxin system
MPRHVNLYEAKPVLNAGAPGFLRAARESGIEVLDITLEHAAAAAALPLLDRDAFDRMIAGQAIADRMILMTSDPVLKRYGGCGCSMPKRLVSGCPICP